MDNLPTYMKIYRKQKKPARTANDPELVYPEAAPHSVEGLLGVTAARLSEPLSRVDTFRKGFGRKSFESLKTATGLDYQTLARALSVSTKTLQRTEVFDVVRSEKLYALADLYATGMSYFGEEGFRRWMDRPLFTLGNRRPVELLDVTEGIALLRTEIIRLQHGIAV